MCKLCNITNEPYSPKRPQLVQERVLKFIQASIDYLGEVPCNTCVNNYRSLVARDVMNEDTYILKKLYRIYINNTEEYKKELAREITNKNRKRTKRTTILGIRKIVLVNGDISYYPEVHTKGKKISLGSFTNINEALKVKIQYMKENNCTNGLKRLENNLKRITND